MKSPILSVTLSAAIALAGAFAAAQTAPIEEIHVTAPYNVIQKKEIRAAGSNLPMLEVSFSQLVPLKGLDLSRTADAQELQNRVQAAAANACNVLDKEYPGSRRENRECLKNAMRVVQPQVDAALAVYKK